MRSRSVVTVIVIVGVAGAGKTTVGRALAARLHWAFIDSDDLHTAASRAKMQAGIALTDDDRQPWLSTIRERIDHAITNRTPTVIACSALKRAYRDRLRRDGVRFAYLVVRPDVLRERLAQRSGHFFTAHLLESQLAELEEPLRALHVNGEGDVDDIVAAITSRIALIQHS